MRSVASFSRWSVTLDLSSTAPVSHLPPGTLTTPPPALAAAAMALAMAAVLETLPSSDFAPKSVIGKSAARAAVANRRQRQASDAAAAGNRADGMGGIIRARVLWGHRIDAIAP